MSSDLDEDDELRILTASTEWRLTWGFLVTLMIGLIAGFGVELSWDFTLFLGEDQVFDCNGLGCFIWVVSLSVLLYYPCFVKFERFVISHRPEFKPTNLLKYYLYQCTIWRLVNVYII